MEPALNYANTETLAVIASLRAADAAAEFTDIIELRAPAAVTLYAPAAPIAYATREEWLNAAIAMLRPIFDVIGATLPESIKVTCGWAMGKPSALGQCFPRSWSAASVNELFIAPTLDDAERVLDVLVHELVHAADDCRDGHKGRFAKWARALDLEGALTATTAGPRLRETCAYIVSLIGAYPHAKLDMSARKKQTARMLKHECSDCGAVWRMAAKWTPIACPCCTAPLAGAGDDADGDGADE